MNKTQQEPAASKTSHKDKPRFVVTHEYRRQSEHEGRF